MRFDSDSHDPNLQGSSHELNLTDLELDQIPQKYLLSNDVYSPTNVKKLTLCHNSFLQIDQISFFSNVISLDVSNNGLTSLPDTIATLTHLKYLMARNNNLEDLPKTLSALNFLDTLSLPGNRIEEIPEVVLRISSLKVLHLGGNRIETVPFAIGQLTNLEVLYLGGNLLRDVPASIGRLASLSSLALSYNRLETIPSTLGELKRLESLSLHNNAIRTLPTEIVKLEKLQQLSLRNNPLVNQFVHDMSFEPPKLKELAGRVIRKTMGTLPLQDILPGDVVRYLQSANQCVNPRCSGVYFEACVEHVKFVDFCGKYRVPLLQFLCSTKCTETASCSSDYSSESEDDQPQQIRMKKVLLG